MKRLLNPGARDPKQERRGDVNVPAGDSELLAAAVSPDCRE